MEDIIPHAEVPDTLVDPKTGEAYQLTPPAMLAIFPVEVVEQAIFEWPPERVAAMLRIQMDWESEVGRHLKRVMSDALYANLIDKGTKASASVEVDGQTLEVKGEKASTAENAEAWDDEAIYDACVELVKEGHLLDSVLDEFKIEQKTVVTCTATTVKNLRERKGPVADAIEALVKPAPRARKAVTVAWK
jgi:hypothetical protein